MIQTSGPVKYSTVKGLLHLDEPWWVDTGIRGRPFSTTLYDGTPGVSMDVTGREFFPAGYIWDGTSRPIVKGQGKVDAAPSLAHDGGFEGIRAMALHPSAAKAFDELYFEMLRERGVAPWRLAIRRAGLFLFGWTARRPSRRQEYEHRTAA